MERVYDDPVRGLRIAIAVFVISLALLLATGGLTVYVLVGRADQAAQFSRDLRRTLVENCRTVGNPLRQAEVEDLEEGILSPHDIRLRLLFPDVSPAIAARLVRASNKVKRDRIADIEPVDCATAYPTP